MGLKDSAYIYEIQWFEPLRNQKWHFFGGKSKKQKHASLTYAFFMRIMFFIFLFTPENVPLLIMQ